MKHPDGTVAIFGPLRISVTEGLIVIQGASLDDRIVLTRPDAQLWARLLHGAVCTVPLLVNALQQAALASRDASALVRMDSAGELPESYDLKTRLPGKQAPKRVK